jgi:hypothetical protein
MFNLDCCDFVLFKHAFSMKDLPLGIQNDHMLKLLDRPKEKKQLITWSTRKCDLYRTCYICSTYLRQTPWLSVTLYVLYVFNLFTANTSADLSLLPWRPKKKPCRADRWRRGAVGQADMDHEARIWPPKNAVLAVEPAWNKYMYIYDDEISGRSKTCSF